MKILIDFFPILLFVGAYKFYDIYVGTGVLMAASLLQLFQSRIFESLLWDTA